MDEVSGILEQVMKLDEFMAYGESDFFKTVSEQVEKFRREIVGKTYILKLK